MTEREIVRRLIDFYNAVAAYYHASATFRTMAPRRVRRLIAEIDRYKHDQVRARDQRGKVEQVAP